MYQSVDFEDFRNAFAAFGREKQFSRLALRALFDYIEQVEEDTNTPIELDVIGLCCTYTEYDYASEAAAAYGMTSETEREAIDWLEEQTEVVFFVGGLLVANF